MSNTTTIAQTITQASAAARHISDGNAAVRAVWNAPTATAVNRATACALLRALAPWEPHGHKGSATVSPVSATAKLRSDTRMGRMSNRSFERERSRAIQASELWYGARYRYPSEIALAILSRYGTVCPDVMHLYTYDGDDIDIEDYLMPTAEKRGKAPTVEALDVLFERS